MKLFISATLLALLANLAAGTCPDTCPADSNVCVPKDPNTRCDDPNEYFECKWLMCRCKKGFENAGGEMTGACVPACPKVGVRKPRRNDPNQIADCEWDMGTKVTTCTCTCRDPKKELKDGVCKCKPEYETVNGVCVTPCVGPKLGEECDAATPCCKGQCIFEQKNDVKGKCLEVGFATCPASADPLKACVDVSNKPGKATCGLPTCKALCNKVCNDNLPYEPEDCSNEGGGNCQGVKSTLNPNVEFTGPCCGCKACKTP